MDTINAILSTFLTLSAVPGGLALALGFQDLGTIWLEGTPFDDYLIPGILLAGVVGGSALVAAVLSYRGHAAAGWASLVAGAAMVGFIVAELVLLNDGEPWPHWIEWFYLALGLLLAGLGLARARGAGTRYVVVYREYGP